jgi:adenylosuccinate lyase
MEFTDGKVGSSAMPHKQNPVASGSIVFLGRLVKANAIPALDYIHAEWEDDHRQGETAWKFVPEVCLLVDAQLELTERLLRTLVVKPENMLRNLDRGGGFVCSEALLMELSSHVGRDRAHALVTELSEKARKEARPLGQVAAADDAVLRYLAPRRVASLFEPKSYLGETKKLVSRVLALYRKQRQKRER